MDNSRLFSRILLAQQIDLREEALNILTRSRHLLAGVLVLVFTASAVPEVCPNPQVPKAERDQADQLLVLSDTEQADAIQTHLPFGTPACPRLLPERGTSSRGQPLHSIYPLSPRHLPLMWPALSFATLCSLVRSSIYALTA